MLDRRSFLARSGGAAVVGAMGLGTISRVSRAVSQAPVEAVLFDAFPVFDPRSVFRLAEEEFPGRGDALREAWLPKVFGYTWLRTVADRYEPFERVIGEALEAAVAQVGVELNAGARQRLVGAFETLDVWPDAVEALDALREAGVRVAFLSNMSERTLRANCERNGIADRVETFLSTDRVRAFKPDPLAYELGERHFGVEKQRLVFCAFGGWDACGAAWYGYPTVWVNRLGAPPERLGGGADVEGRGLDVLRTFVQERSAGR